MKHKKMQHINQYVAFFFVKNLVGIKNIRSFASSFERESADLCGSLSLTQWLIR